MAGDRWSIRRGRDPDAPAAADLWLRSRLAARPAVPAPVHSEADVRSWFAGHVVRECELWLAVTADTDAPVGLLVLDGGWVDQLYVDPDRTGRGIGSGLLALALRERPDGLQLWTFQANVGARRFYERHGFVAVQLTDGARNEERTPDVRYAWPGPRK